MVYVFLELWSDDPGGERSYIFTSVLGVQI